MHFEILVEDASGKIALESIVEKILAPSSVNHTYRVISYSGIGTIPKNLSGKPKPLTRMLLNELPRLLKGYGNAYKQYSAAVIVVVDRDKRDCREFKKQLLGILNACDPTPETRFRIAIEEGESWLLGDGRAVLAAYPKAKKKQLEAYQQGDIGGTWEDLAEAIHAGDAKKLEKMGYPQLGIVKSRWAKVIAPHMDVDRNCSKSFQVFRDALRSLAGIPTD